MSVSCQRSHTEEDTAEGGKGADEVGLPCDRSLDAIDIAGGSERAARHGCGVAGFVYLAVWRAAAVVSGRATWV